MFTLYYSQGSSALAPHILLEEAGAPYALVEVPLASGAHLQPPYLNINPKGRVPALATPDGVLTENPAILDYIARRFPTARLLPDTLFEQAQGQALSAYLCATMHVAFAHLQRAARWADDPAAQAAMRTKVAPNLADCAALIEAHYLPSSSADAPWVFGARYTLSDAYLFLAPRWLDKAGVSLEAYPKLAAHYQAMRERPATRAALDAQGLA
jgi:glutathione S-transferase